MLVCETQRDNERDTMEDALTIQKTQTKGLVFFSCGNVTGIADEKSVETMAREYADNGGKVIRLSERNN